MLKPKIPLSEATQWIRLFAIDKAFYQFADNMKKYKKIQQTTTATIKQEHAGIQSELQA